MLYAGRLEIVVRFELVRFATPSHRILDFFSPADVLDVLLAPFGAIPLLCSSVC